MDEKEPKPTSEDIDLIKLRAAVRVLENEIINIEHVLTGKPIADIRLEYEKLKSGAEQLLREYGGFYFTSNIF